MRLIDADELKELYEDYEGLKVPCEVVLQNIDDMPTAYDIDKVVKQLEEEKNNCNTGCYEDYDDYEQGRFNAYDDAIKIVKGGSE